MEAPETKRRSGRRWALQMIVQADLNPFVDADMILSHFWEQQWSCRQEAENKADDEMDEIAATLLPGERLASSGLRVFTEKLVRGVLADTEALDEIITPFCEHWSLDRVGVIERCVLRLGIYEISKTDTPAPVVINEAVELAKYFSNAEAGHFVNGILDRYAKSRK